MHLGGVAAALGVAGSLATLAALGAPYALIADHGTGLGVYYAAGPLGAGAVAFLAVLHPVVVLSGTRGRADPPTAAGMALVVGVAMLAIAALRAASVPPESVFSFPVSWMGWHRWAVVGVVAVVPAAAAVYARETL